MKTQWVVTLKNHSGVIKIFTVSGCLHEPEAVRAAFHKAGEKWKSSRMIKLVKE